MNPINWVRRKLFNQRAADISTKVLSAPLPYAEPRNRAERRGPWMGRAKRAYRAATMIRLRQPRPGYPVLTHCIIGACKRRPRYRGQCWTHFNGGTS